MDVSIFKIVKGMYVFPQSRLLANELLKKCLAQYGFHPKKSTPGLWTYEKKWIQFTLVVDDFVIQYENKEDSEYPIKAL